MYTTKLNKTTKRASNWIEQYNKSTCYSVSSFYVSRVYRKESIEEDIKRKMIENNCHGYKVLNGNSSFFTCAYKNSDDSILYVETIGNTFEIEL